MMGSSGGSLKGVMELFHEAWGQFVQCWKTMIGILAIPNIIGLVVWAGYGALSSALGLDNASNNSVTLVNIVLIIIIHVAVTIIGFWGHVALITVSFNSSMRVKNAFTQSRSLIAPFVWIYILTMAGMGLGLLFFIIPGIIVSVWWMFSHYVLVAEGVRGTKALGKSRAYVQGRWWKVAGRMVGYGLIMMVPVIILVVVAVGLYVTHTTGAPLFMAIILGVLFMIVYSLIAGPLGILYVSALYRSLRASAS